ncbi:Nitrogenase molybdenum-iron protein beta chain [Paraburkholderia rhynchosiae]|uniref:Nitrogenase molybdenum-iron protein beta chain n=1 Tax=Paraburkholderia rhynchosiae TaxID=487049 RepID=A0A6J5AQI3_9BURK|nr:nitrogenase component 1 [Paraburkholderia rhynchosiae]CAB3670237.1 Nitrogenase molybdenum-iron protein beta chain [Paraburkholderia rhynchosiae]
MSQLRQITFYEKGRIGKQKGSVREDYDVPFAHTPAFFGNHVTSCDNALPGILKHFWGGRAGTATPLARVPDDSVNFIGGFDDFVVGNMREIRRKFDLFGVTVNIICDPSETWNASTDGDFRMCNGEATQEEVGCVLNAKATFVFHEYCCEKTRRFTAEHDQEIIALNAPIGVVGTDHFLMTGRRIPAKLEMELRQLVDAMADSQPNLHGKRYALYGDADQMLAFTQFLRELSEEPAHVLSTNGTDRCASKVRPLWDASPYGAQCKVYPKRDLWHLRSLLFIEPVQFRIGNTHGKYLERHTGHPSCACIPYI